MSETLRPAPVPAEVRVAMQRKQVRQAFRVVVEARNSGVGGPDGRPGELTLPSDVMGGDTLKQYELDMLVAAASKKSG